MHIEEYVIPGNIIFRQRGSKWHPGENCDMGRDHTIFAKEAGYVRFYRDPARHPKRQYIGVALEKGWKLPTPQHAVRRRRLGMLAVKRTDIDLDALRNTETADVRTTIPSADTPAMSKPPMTKAERRAAEKEKRTGKIPVEELRMRRGYQWRMTNAEIGRAPERAGIKVPVFKPGNRFLAWRMRSRRRERAALRRAMQASAKKRKGNSTKKKKKRGASSARR